MSWHFRASDVNLYRVTQYAVCQEAREIHYHTKNGMHGHDAIRTPVKQKR